MAGVLANCSAIVPDESGNFLSANEHGSLFGTGNIGPDRIRMSMANVLKREQTGGAAQSGVAGGLLNQMDQYDQY